MRLRNRARRNWDIPPPVRRGERPPPFRPAPVPADPLASLPSELRAALPNVLVVGAGKCGTSALHSYLAAHPDIGMSEQKELQLFGGPKWRERLPHYATRFDPTRPVRGESSPSYTMDPYVPDVPEEMAAVLPQPRFLYIVGEPIQRVVAHWSEQHMLGNDQRPLDEALDDADDPYNPYTGGSRYGHQLSRYAEVFGADRVLVLDQLDLRERRAQTLREVFTFLGVDPDFVSPVFGEEANPADRKLEFNALGRWLRDRRRQEWRPLDPAPPLRWLIGRPLRRPDLDARTRERIAAVLRADIDRFRELTGRPFDHWAV